MFYCVSSNLKGCALHGPFRFAREIRLRGLEIRAERYLKLVNSLDRLNQSIVLAQTELRDNPLYEEIVGSLSRIRDVVTQLRPDLEVDDDEILKIYSDVIRKLTMKKVDPRPTPVATPA